MSDKQTFSAAEPARSRIDGRLIAVAVILAVLAFEAALVRLAGPIEPPAIDATALVGP